MGQILLLEITLAMAMGYAGLAEILQAEMMDRMEAIKYVRSYIDDLLLVISSGGCMQQD